MSGDASRETAADGMHARTRLLVGYAGLERLAASRVIVFGLGGVGSAAAEQLCRAGVGALTLVDFDVVREGNLNRQVLALRSTLGRPKAEVTTGIPLLTQWCKSCTLGFRLSMQSSTWS